jgi:hypothetical protein
MSEDRFDPGTPRFEPGSLEPEPPHWTLWPIYLAFRPKVFFESFAAKPAPLLVTLTFVFLGIAGAIDKTETRTLLNPDNPLYESLVQSWPAFWGFACATGLVGAAGYYYLGGWWYRVRIRWSGSPDPDPPLSRRIYAYSAQVWAVPSLLYYAWMTTVYDTPLQSSSGDDWGWVPVTLALFWSIYVSYRGVRTKFDVGPWRARIWFLILPGSFYLVAFIGIIAAVLFGGADFEPPPDLRSTIRLERQGFALEHPGNWSVDTWDEDYDPDTAFAIAPTLADAQIQFWFYDQPMESSACVEETFQNLSAAYEMTDVAPVDRWGQLEGAGYTAVAVIDGVRFDLLTFCSTERVRPFEIMQIVQESVSTKLKPGYDLIRDTLELRPATELRGAP